MNKSLIFVFLTVALVATSVAIWRAPGREQKTKPTETPPPNPAAKQTPNQPPKQVNKESAEPVRTTNASAGGPDIALSVNCIQESVAVEGKPVLIEASIKAAREDGEIVKVDLSKPGGFWGELLTIEVCDNRGQVVARAVPKLISKGDAKISLDGATFGWIIWTLNSSLAPGTYSFRAKLDTKTALSGWKGAISSPPATLIVKTASDELSKDEQLIVAMTETRVLALQGRSVDALAACERFLATHPNDILMLEEKGDTLAGAGNFKEAVKVYDQALAVKEPKEPDSVPEPPFLLLQKRSRAAAQAAKAGG